ncbi:MAG: EAL domain-containing protein [Gemmatimonadota bacterium]
MTQSLVDCAAAPPVWSTPTEWKYSYAFQPIVDLAGREIFSYEALIRGTVNESAGQTLNRVPPSHLHDFDRQSREAAMELAGKLGLPCCLNLNVLPSSLDDGDGGVRRTVACAERSGLRLEQLILEVTENEIIVDRVGFARIVNRYRRLGIKVAIDDFGAGYSGLNLLADFQPDMIKLDMYLVRGIEWKGPQQSIVRAIAQVCRDLGIEVVAEGVETTGERDWLVGEGVELQQGYLFARPGFECLPPVRFE